MTSITYLSVILLLLEDKPEDVNLKTDYVYVWLLGIAESFFD